MALKFKVSRKEDVPAELQSLYVERNGAFVLDADGVVEKERLDEFRTNNLTLQKQVEELTKSFEGIDAAQARELLKKQRDLEVIPRRRRGCHLPVETDPVNTCLSHTPLDEQDQSILRTSLRALSFVIPLAQVLDSTRLHHFHRPSSISARCVFGTSRVRVMYE